MNIVECGINNLGSTLRVIEQKIEIGAIKGIKALDCLYIATQRDSNRYAGIVEGMKIAAKCSQSSETLYLFPTYHGTFIFSSLKWSEDSIHEAVNLVQPKTVGPVPHKVLVKMLYSRINLLAECICAANNERAYLRKGRETESEYNHISFVDLVDRESLTQNFDLFNINDIDPYVISQIRRILAKPEVTDQVVIEACNLVRISRTLNE